MILYIENPKNYPRPLKKTLELTSKFSKVAGHKINILKLVVFLYIKTNNLKGKLRKRSH